MVGEGRKQEGKGDDDDIFVFCFRFCFVAVVWCGVVWSVLLVWVLDKMLIFGGFGGGDVRERRKGFFFSGFKFHKSELGIFGFLGRRSE